MPPPWPSSPVGPPAFDGKFTFFTDFCALGVYAQNGVVEDLGYNTTRFLNGGGTTRLVCNSQGAYYGIRIWESDGGLKEEDDNFGYRFYSCCNFPGGATVGVVQSHYVNTIAATRSAYLRIVVR